MDFWELSRPTAKKWSAPFNLRQFPIDEIPSSIDESSFTGIFNGLSVEIFDPAAIKHLFTNGCFGISTKTKNTPQELCNFRVKNMEQAQFEQKCKWDDRFKNQNPECVVVNLLFPDEKSTPNPGNNQIKENMDDIKNEKCDDNEVTDKTADSNNVDEQNVDVKTESMEIDVKVEIAEHIVNDVPEMNLVEDPFPIEETLALLPEEAFFLHFSLRCLKVMNFDQTHEFTTEELLEKFSESDPKFIHKFIVYHFYRSKNWVVRSALKFGGDFLLYYKGPRYYHASYVVLVNDNEDETNQLDMQSNFRVSESTNKDVIMATITRPNDLEYTSRSECLRRLNEFKITEIIPKRFTINQLLIASSQQC